MSHYITKCKECGVTIAQCRCIGPQEVTYGLCEKCQIKPILNLAIGLSLEVPVGHTLKETFGAFYHDPRVSWKSIEEAVERVSFLKADKHVEVLLKINGETEEITLEEFKKRIL